MLQDIPRQLHGIDTTLEAFSEHLRTHRGASPGTCDRNSREVRKLLERTCGDAPLDFSRLTTAALRAFVIERATTWSPRTGRRAATAVRSFLPHTSTSRPIWPRKNGRWRSCRTCPANRFGFARVIISSPSLTASDYAESIKR